MNLLSFNQLRKTNVERCEAVFHPLKSWIPEQWGNATAGEVGELCNKLKKRFGRKETSTTLESIADEAADVVCYLDLLTASIGIDLGDAVRKKFNQISDEKQCDIKL